MNRRLIGILLVLLVALGGCALIRTDHVAIDSAEPTIVFQTQVP